MNLDSIEKLYVHELKDLWSAEHQFQNLSSQLNNNAADGDLDNAINGLREQSRSQLERIERIFDDLEYGPKGHKCKGMEGLVTEAKEVMGEADDPDVRDAAIASQLNRILHYEMAGYGVARALAEKMGRYADADVLDEVLGEKGTADRKVTRLAHRKLNFEALTS